MNFCLYFYLFYSINTYVVFLFIGLIDVKDTYYCTRRPTGSDNESADLMFNLDTK
jgi:hypothetical protein